MTKLDFLYELRAALSTLPREDIERYVDYYSEMISDRTEDGMSEEEAVADIGNASEIAQKILGDTPKKEAPKEIKRERRMDWPWIVLIVLGFPLWFSVLVSAFAVVISLFASLFSVVVSLWSVVAALWGTALGGIVLGIALLALQNVPAGLALVGIAVFSIGLSIFAVYGCKAVTKGAVALVKMTAKGIKRLFVRKEGAR